ncbi:TIGR03084 family metal-binding protein [Kibdelosporangium lantanae]
MASGGTLARMSTPPLQGLLDDLRAEGDSLETLVAPLPADAWATPTPADGWTIAHQIAHLAWTDEASVTAATNPDTFKAMVTEAMKAPMTFVDDAAERGSRRSPEDLLAWWRTSRVRLVDALAQVPDGTKLPWFGPPMSVMSMATARVMETWAHGLDVADALGIERTPTVRLRHVAHISVRTRNFAYQIRGLTPPDEEIRVELAAPDGSTWTWGPEDAAQRIVGSALDFCLVSTQRRHRDDTDLKAVGTDADKWLNIAQAFAGLPGPGRQPR